CGVGEQLCSHIVLANAKVGQEASDGTVVRTAIILGFDSGEGQANSRANISRVAIARGQATDVDRAIAGAVQGVLEPVCQCLGTAYFLAVAIVRLHECPRHGVKVASWPRGP